MEKIGYDSDTHRYTFRDSDGCIYEGGESGGSLTLVSRPTQRSKRGKSPRSFCIWPQIITFVLDDEPIRLMPNSPTRPANGVATYPSSPTSPTSFRDFLPAHTMTGAPPQEPPRRKTTLKAPGGSSSLHRAQTSPGSAPSQNQKSLWNVVRSKTVPTKMRDVVENIVRRDSGRKGQSKDRQYERLGGGSPVKTRPGQSPSQHGKQRTT